MIRETRGRGQGVSGEPGDLRTPDHDVDAFPAQFLHDVLDARSPDAHTGAHRVHIAVLGHDRHLGPRPRIPGHAQDAHRAVGHLGDFAGEKRAHVVGVGARDDDLWPAALGQDLDDEGLDAVAAFVPFAGDLFFLGQKGLGAAEVDDPAGAVPTLDDAADDLALSVLVFLVDDFLLGVAHALDDHLLGGLGRDAAQILDFELEPHLVVELDVGIDLAGLFQVISESGRSTSSTTTLNW